MKKIVTKTILLLAIVSVAACSSTPVRRSFKETWKDTMTAQKVRYKLMRDKDVKKSRMHVEVFRGQVTLTGRAVSPNEKTRAETIAKSVKNVTGVENYVHVVGGGAATTAVATTATPAATAPATATPVSTTAGTIEEKLLVKEEVIITDNIKTDAPISTVPTIRESTGKPAARVATRRAPEPKAAPKVANKPKAAAPIRVSEDDAPAAVRPTTVAVPSKVPAASTKVPAVQTEPAQVVGKSSTGLPWDGEVYEDDVSRVTPATAAKPAVSAAPKVAAPKVAAPKVATPAPAATSAPKSATASRAPIIKEKPAESAVTPPTDDLAREAAQELEKLRSKR